ncbi:hypothetical protein E2C01_064011 [Portunus trituberculatus]|uniref:Uncharacterized protein n=1 Tax=Portunus trituberculatus TaxID=210409 RepID=A0A5B7HBZ9_PORTR|nr:hypothetical protein [Portunus trituberculatus]
MYYLTHARRTPITSHAPRSPSLALSFALQAGSLNRSHRQVGYGVRGGCSAGPVCGCPGRGATGAMHAHSAVPSHLNTNPAGRVPTSLHTSHQDNPFSSPAYCTLQHHLHPRPHVMIHTLPWLPRCLSRGLPKAGWSVLKDSQGGCICTYAGYGREGDPWRLIMQVGPSQAWSPRLLLHAGCCNPVLHTPERLTLPPLHTITAS